MGDLTRGFVGGWAPAATVAYEVVNPGAAPLAVGERLHVDPFEARYVGLYTRAYPSHPDYLSVWLVQTEEMLKKERERQAAPGYAGSRLPIVLVKLAT